MASVFLRDSSETYANARQFGERLVDVAQADVNDRVIEWRNVRVSRFQFVKEGQRFRAMIGKRECMRETSGCERCRRTRLCAWRYAAHGEAKIIEADIAL